MKKLESLGRSLSKEEQKKIMGGNKTIEGGGCSFTFIPDSGTCGVRNNGATIAYGMTQGRAIEIATLCDWNWCCESC